MTLNLAAIFGSGAPGCPATIPEPALAVSTADPSAPVMIQAVPGPGGGLTLHCPTPELAEAIEAGRPALETLLAALTGEPESPAVAPLGPDGWPADSVEPGEPCPRCGALEPWLDVTGGEHCGGCEADKLTRGLKLAERAARLRRNRPRPKPASPAAPGREPAAVPDGSDVAGKRPVAASVGASTGCQAGQG